MKFVKSRSMKVSVTKEQEKQLSAKSKIEEACRNKDVLAFDIYKDDQLVGFVMLREYEKGCFFLWDYAVDHAFQNRHIGTAALRELIILLRQQHGMHTMTTTYIWGNEHAKHIYEAVGFKETDIVDESGCHEVNMRLQSL